MNKPRSYHTIHSLITLVLVMLANRTALTEELRINEFMAGNKTTVMDEDGDPSDWIEIWNTGSATRSLLGYYLTDEIQSPRLWAFPDIRLEGGAHMLVFASGKDRRTPDSELHTSFQLKREGEDLALFRVEEETLRAISIFANYPKHQTDVSFGHKLSANPAETGFMLQPTPGTRNRGDTLEGFVEDTRFSVDRGYYENPFDLEITSNTRGATLIYTLDGTLPGMNNGIRVPSGSPARTPVLNLSIRDTTLVRVMAFKEGFQSTNIDTHSYLFHDSILHQTGRGDPFNKSIHWGHAGPDWEMDPEILAHEDPEIRPSAEDFLRLPTLSMVMDFEEMFGRSGIYVRGQSVERKVSAEWINPLGAPQAPNTVKGFQRDSTVQIVGGSSPNRWKSDKLSMRLKFTPDLDYPIFGREAARRFDTLVLDARLNNVWHYGGGSEPIGQRNRAQYVRDQYAANLHRAMGGLSPHGKHVHLMINGVYWGIHTLHERPDDNFAASYYGGSNRDYDSIKHHPNDVLQGTASHYKELHQLAGRDLSIQTHYEAVEAMLDIDAFIDYMLMNYYIGNGDWAHHNWYASYNHMDPSGKWRFHSWDAEKGLHSVQTNVTRRNDTGGPTYLQQQLARNEGFRMRFADRAYDHLQYGPLSPVQAGLLYRAVSDPLELPIRLESARWGDNQRNKPYTQADWISIRDSLFGLSNNRSLKTFDFFERRSDIVLQQFSDMQWLPSLKPPVFNQHGGHIQNAFPIHLESPVAGTIYYSLDGTDPLPPASQTPRKSIELISESHPKRAIIPVDGSLAERWMTIHFDDRSWNLGVKGAGYDNNSGYENMLSPELNFKDQVDTRRVESIYMRIPFEIGDPSVLDQLNLGMRYDDGFVAYLNGKEIARANAPSTTSGNPSWNTPATSGHSDNQATVFQHFDVSSSLHVLKPGKNLLAIHGLNVSATSSDMLIWPTLRAVETEEDDTSNTPITKGIMRYEGPFSLKSSATVRARVLQRNTWSPLLSADFIVDAVPPTASNLVLAAIHYHPSPPNLLEIEAGFKRRSDFEFLQVINTSEENVDLRGLRFTSGIRYVFDETANIRELPPGQTLIIASNPAAFELRFGNHLNMAGSFQEGTKLNNGGERIVATVGSNVVIDVQYEDGPPWPILADGKGAFLSLKDPQIISGADPAASWEALDEHGMQNSSHSLADYLDWLEGYYSKEDLARNEISDWMADPDLDGMDNLMEYFHGSNPADGKSSPHWIRVFNDPNEPAAGWTLEFSRMQPLPGVLWEIESSRDLVDWTPLPADLLITKGSRVQHRWHPTGSGASMFFRLRILAPK